MDKEFEEILKNNPTMRETYKHLAEQAAMLQTECNERHKKMVAEQKEQEEILRKRCVEFQQTTNEALADKHKSDPQFLIKAIERRMERVKKYFYCLDGEFRDLDTLLKYLHKAICGEQE